METILGYATNTVVVGVACLVVGVLFSQKIKDYISGVPTGFRAAMNAVETKAKSDAQAAVADVFSKIVPAPAKAVAAPAVTAAVNPAPELPKA